MNLEIQDELTRLTLQCKVEKVQQLFDKQTFQHLPVLDGYRYLGCISELDIRTFDTEKTLKDYQDYFEKFFVKKEVNPLEVLQAISNHQTNIMPVLCDDQLEYLGYYDLNSVLDNFTDMPFLREYGNIIVVRKGVNDYSFSEVSQIVESNNLKLYSMYISKMDHDVAELTLKVSDGDLNAVLRTFRRYSYEVMSSYFNDMYLNDLKSKSRYLGRYLNI